MISLVLAFHNHQPVGNFEWVIEEAYERSYLPLMKMLEEYPGIRFGQHYTGILLDWFAQRHPEFLELIATAVRDGRVELVSGGYYEPILSMLPERDRHAQLTLLNQKIEIGFGAHPRGMWLAERVWEPSLPTTLSDAGLSYTFLDDTHFRHAGLSESELTGYFITEDQGNALAVLPIDKRLRYTMPFAPPEITIEYLHGLHRKGHDRLVVFADDGEKFGSWPGTFESVYAGGWLRRFCELLKANAGWIRTLRPHEAITQLEPAGRLYLPTASYAEMLHWALPNARSYMQYEAFENQLKHEGSFDAVSQFVRGGFWRNFLVKYPDANAMQKKMIRVSRRFDDVRRQHEHGDAGARALLADAYEHLLASQCNCPYWHGVFGGLYLANIRAAIYREMIIAERQLDVVDGIDQVHLDIVDYDIDGFDEVIAENALMALYVAPARGGSIFEIDHKPTAYNFCDVIERRREGYHAHLVEHARRVAVKQPMAAMPDVRESMSANAAPLEGAETDAPAKSIHDAFRVKEQGLEKHLVYDQYRHAILIDHFFGPDISPETLRAGTAHERGDFVNGRYEFSCARHPDSQTTIHLRRRGAVDGHAVIVDKSIRIGDKTSDVDVEYRISSVDGHPLTGFFGIEMTYSMSAGNEPDRYYELDARRVTGDAGRLSSQGEAIVSRFALVDEWLRARIDVALERPAHLFRAPIETVSQSENGFERNYQGSLLLALWDLGGVGEWRIGLRQRITGDGRVP